MKFLLMLHMNPSAWEALTEDERQAVMNAHEGFMAAIRESGEFINTQALADPSTARVVRVRDGVPVVSDGPYIETKEFLAGYYLVDCESQARALELASMIPDAAVPGMGVEVRQIMFDAGMEM
ncbi:YciI family protein [Actinokineospora sp. UTMC 2448]|uniref:YciI family protein n=1 Tax=Actinokineospora sp. UTMC 2448 TaxID=2268449 RepID=UPI00216463BE|nr:YciI family protein [Actinokineospora sp. UTMC 2448]UVS77557.1 YCII-related domain protein [Actinokineospora sp. UTMC 2448]